MKLSRTTLCALTFATGLVAGQAGATLDVSQQPLILGGFVEPNVLFVLDDSGSMHWETMPDALTGLYGATTGNNTGVMWMFPFIAGVHGAGDYGVRRVPRFEGNVAARFRSPHNNTVYYDPAITYQPWIRADGTLMPDAPPDAAWHNPVNPGLGTRDLTSSQRGRADWVNNGGGHTDGWINFYPAVYYHYSGSGNIGLESSYERVEIVHPGPSYSGHGRENRVEDGCSDGVCTSEAEIQNFANWYSYHRNRIFAARAGIGLAFSEQGEKMRVGYGTINTASHTVDGQSTQTVIHGVHRFDQETRGKFFEELYERAIPPQATPLREALQGSGEYYRRTDNRGPWSSSPGQNDGQNDVHLECRQSYTVLMTDGYWNSSGSIDFDSVGNVDGDDGSPFADGHANTLADVAMHYWENDLRTDLEDRVPTSELNSANWQHMVTFGVGLGVRGELDIDPDTIFAAIRNNDPIAIDWPSPFPVGDSLPAKIDDLLHAGVNSRGGFFNAQDANEFSRQLSNVLQQILARAGAITAFSVSSSRIDTDSLVFQAEFGSEPWWGDIVAINPNNGNLVRKASESVPTWSSRQIITTTDGQNTHTFAPGNADLRVLIAPEGEEDNDALIDAITEYVAGSDEHEYPDSDFDFRVRGDQCGGEFNDSCAIGDIVNSQLVFVGKRNEGWARLGTDDGGGAGGYGAYFESKQSRDDMLYVGANDGMLHAFNAQADGDADNPTVSLRETFAYVPRAVLENLHELSVPEYGHRFFVDGQISVADAYLNGRWRTVLVGTLGAGGQAVYALDVTDPGSPQVLWEVSSSDEDLEDLGYNFGRPVITRLASGDWAAIFGNGYKDGHNQPSLFVINLANGNLIDKIEPELSGDQPESNGLSGPAIALDPATRSHAARAYAGDLDGNVWRFDLVSGTASRLFQAPDNNPIKAEPELAVHAAGGIMVYVGSGKLFETDDAEITADEPVQSFYALRDTGNNEISVDNLAEIEIAEEVNGQRRLETSATNFESGWRLDLVLEENNVGERVLHRAQVGFGAVLFATFEPSLDICDGGGLVRLYVLDALSGVGDLDDSGMGTVEIPIGAPVAPPIAILPPSYGDTPPTEVGYAPGDSSDSVPALPDPENPDDLRGERDQWCGSVGYWDPVGGQFVPFATLCEGRQVWREIR